MQTGPGLSSASRLRDRLGCQDAALRDVLATLEARDELRATGGAARSPQRHYVPTDAMRLYVTGAAGATAEEVLCRGDVAGRSGESVREEVPPPLAATSSRVQAPTHARGKKYSKPPVPAVLGVFGDSADTA